MNKKKPLIKRLNELAESRAIDTPIKDESTTNEIDTEAVDRDTLETLYGDKNIAYVDESNQEANNNESERDDKSALNVLYADRPDILNEVVSQEEMPEHIDAEKVENNDPTLLEATDTERNEMIDDEQGGSGALTVSGSNTLTSAVAVRRIRENNKLKINKFDAFFIKLWSLIVAIIVGMANGINWVVAGIFKKRLPDKYVRAFVATVIVILLIVLFTVPFSIEVKTEEEIEIFSDGLLPVAEKVFINSKAETRWGYMNQSGKIVIEAKYIEALPFTHGVAWVRTATYDQNGNKIEDYWSLINKKGNSVGKDHLKFDHDTRGVGMERPVGEFPKDVKLAWVYIANKYGFIKSNGTYAITPRYELVESYSNGLARVRMGSMEYYINQKGNQVGNTFNQVKSFSEGLGAIMINDIWGFMNTKGDIVIDPRYNDVTCFKGGYAAVRNGEAYGIIDTKGRTVVEPIQYVDMVPLSQTFKDLIDSIRLDR